MSSWIDTDDHITPCGTAACIAGHAVLIDAIEKGKRGWRSAALRLLKMRVDVQESAEGLLQLSMAESTRLFFFERWPEQFKRPFRGVTLSGADEASNEHVGAKRRT